MRILVTRPEPDGARTAAILRERGHEVMLAPLLRIESIPDADLGGGPWAAILITSANAARAAAVHKRRGELLKLPVLAVGRASADMAREMGFADVASADGDGRDLIRMVAARFAGQAPALLYLAGENRAVDLAGELAGFGVPVHTAVAYRAAAATRLPDEIRASLQAGRIDAVAHFSRRSAAAYLDCSRDILSAALAPVHYCLSAGTAEPLRTAGAADVRAASHPDEASLVALIGHA